MSENKIENENQTLASISSRLEFRKMRFISAVFVFTASFALYFFTLAPTVTLVDSGELILAARTLGVAHPPGFPLYVLLAHAASLLPFGNIAVRIHLASALFAAFASAIMTLLVIEAILVASIQNTENKSKNTPGKKNNHLAKETKPNSEQNSDSISISAPAVTAGLLFAFSRTLWAYATIAEVYTLNTLLIVIIFGLMLGWRRVCLESRANQTKVSNQKLYLAALIFGLALGVHHVTVGLMLPALAVWCFQPKVLVFSRLDDFSTQY